MKKKNENDLFFIVSVSCKAIFTFVSGSDDVFRPSFPEILHAVARFKRMASL